MLFSIVLAFLSLMSQEQLIIMTDRPEWNEGTNIVIGSPIEIDYDTWEEASDKPVALKNAAPQNETNSICGLRKVNITSKCGDTAVTTHRIAGGCASHLGEWPWNAYIRIHQFQCGGCLINELYVLSAAHCVTNFDTGKEEPMYRISLYFGILMVIAAELHKVQVYHPERVIRHENFNLKAMQHDISLLQLKTKVVFSDNCQPICLPWDPPLSIDNFAGKEGYVVGAGDNEWKPKKRNYNMMHTKVTVYQDSYCQNYILDSNSGPYICSGLAGHSPCTGDSGGPLMYEYQNQWYAIGVVSTSTDCETDPAIYSRITSYIPWIKHHMGLS